MTRKYFIYGQIACAIVTWLGLMALAFGMPEGTAVSIYGCVGFLIFAALAPNIIAYILSYIAFFLILTATFSLRFFDSSFHILPLLNDWLTLVVLLGIIITMTIRYFRLKKVPPVEPVQNA